MSDERVGELLRILTPAPERLVEYAKELPDQTGPPPAGGAGDAEALADDLPDAGWSDWDELEEPADWPDPPNAPEDPFE